MYALVPIVASQLVDDRQRRCRRRHKQGPACHIHPPQAPVCATSSTCARSRVQGKALTSWFLQELHEPPALSSCSRHLPTFPRRIRRPIVYRQCQEERVRHHHFHQQQHNHQRPWKELLGPVYTGEGRRVLQHVQQNHIRSTNTRQFITALKTRSAGTKRVAFPPLVLRNWASISLDKLKCTTAIRAIGAVRAPQMSYQAFPPLST